MYHITFGECVQCFFTLKCVLFFKIMRNLQNYISLLKTVVFLIDFLFYILYIIYVVWIFKISDSYIALPPHPRAEETSRLLSMCFITENFLLSRTVVRSRYEWILEFTRSGPRKNVKYDAQQNRPLNTVFHANHTIFNTCLSSSVG